MKKPEIIVRKYADKLITGGYLKKVFETKPSVIGIAKLDQQEDKSFKLLVGADYDNVNLESFQKFQDNMKSSDVLFHFGEVPISFEDPATLQPFNIFVMDEAAAEQEPALVCLIEGNFPDFETDRGNNSVEYMVFRDFVKPMFEEQMQKAGGHYLKMLENIENDKVFKRAMDKIGTGRGVITLLGVDGKGPITFGTNELFKQFDWGQVSNHLGYEEKPQAQAGSKLSKLSLSMFGKKDEVKTEAPAQQEVKANPVQPMATAPTKSKFSFDDKPAPSPEPKVKDSAMATAANTKVPADTKTTFSEATHVRLKPILEEDRGTNAVKKWYRRNNAEKNANGEGIIPSDFHHRPEVWVSKADAARMADGMAKKKAAAEAQLAKAAERVKSFQDIDKSAVNTVEPKKPVVTDTMAKHLPASPPLQPELEPMPTVSAASKKKLGDVVDTLYKSKVLDSSSRIVLNPKELAKEPKMPTFLDISGMELHEVVKLPTEAIKLMIKDNDEIAVSIIRLLQRTTGSLMSAEDLNPPVEEAEDDKYKSFNSEKQNDAEAGAIPAAVDKKAAAGSGKFRFAM